jgi:hypothetical protein
MGFGGPTKSPIHLWTIDFSQWVKWPGGEANHLHSSDIEVNNAWSCISTAPCAFMSYTSKVLPITSLFYRCKSWDFILKKEEHGLTLCSGLSGITQLEAMLSGCNAGGL